MVNGLVDLWDVLWKEVKEVLFYIRASGLVPDGASGAALSLDLVRHNWLKGPEMAP